MTVLKDKFTTALNERNNIIANEAHDINSYVWKGPKEELNGQKFQDEIKLVDASDSQLLDFYAHCKSMLYSKDPNNLGRYLLIEKIREDRDKCNAELFMRYLEGSYTPIDDTEPKAKYLREMFYGDLRNFMARNTETFPVSKWNEIPISEFIEVKPAEFSRLTIELAYLAADNRLGAITRKPITLNFLTKMGIWLEESEKKDLTERDEATGKKRDYFEVIKERLGLKPTVRLKADRGGLSYREFRAMVQLKTNRFNDLTTEQLYALRRKVLYRLEDSCTEHIRFWEGKINELQEVAVSRGWSF